jgi:hypothetical protein
MKSLAVRGPLNWVWTSISKSARPSPLLSPETSWRDSSTWSSPAVPVKSPSMKMRTTQERATGRVALDQPSIACLRPGMSRH